MLAIKNKGLRPIDNTLLLSPFSAHTIRVKEEVEKFTLKMECPFCKPKIGKCLNNKRDIDENTI